MELTGWLILTTAGLDVFLEIKWYILSCCNILDSNPAIDAAGLGQNIANSGLCTSDNVNNMSLLYYCVSFRLSWPS